MRIVHVSDCYLPRLGGIEQQVHDLAARQQASGDDVRIVSSVPGPDVLDDLPVTRPPTSRTSRTSERPLIRYEWAFRGRRAALADDADIVHAHVSAMSPLAFFTAAATARAGTPTALTVHSLWNNLAPIFRTADLAVRMRRAPVAWSAVSELAAEPVRRLLGPSVPVLIVPNGVDYDKWRTVPAARRPDRITIVTVGRLAARKRPRHLVRMLREVRERVPASIAIEAVIVGEGPQRTMLQHRLDDSGVGRWVRLAGRADQEQIRRLFQSTDIYVAPATLESFGMAALEARCAGIPVVARRVSGIAEFITHDLDGLLVDDDEAMVDAIVRLATSPATLARLRNHNLETAPAVGWPLVRERCDELYAQARTSQGSPSRMSENGTRRR